MSDTEMLISHTELCTYVYISVKNSDACFINKKLCTFLRHTGSNDLPTQTASTLINPDGHKQKKLPKVLIQVWFGPQGPRESPLLLMISPLPLPSSVSHSLISIANRCKQALNLTKPNLQAKKLHSHITFMLPSQREKGSPVNPGKQAQSKGPSVMFPLKHCARNPQGLKIHGSAWKSTTEMTF